MNARSKIHVTFMIGMTESSIYDLSARKSKRLNLQIGNLCKETFKEELSIFERKRVSGISIM